MYVVRNGRFELAPSIAFTTNDQFVTHDALAVALNYWVSNVLAVGASFLWYQGLESESDLNFSVRRSTRLAVPITEYQLGAHLNFTYVPIYGKFAMFNDSIFQWDSYLVGGVGMMRTRPVAVVDPAVRTFDFDWRVAFNVGIGLRVFVTRYFAIFGELRDYMYLEKLENLNVELGANRENMGTWTDQNATLTNNVMAHVGITLFFPFTFEYRYPK
jgi:outer membrane beta-barrel protein